MHSRSFKPLLWGILFILLVSFACSLPSSSEETQEPSSKAPTKEPAQESAKPVEVIGPKPISNLQDVQGAVIQIEAEGTFVDFEGTYLGAGRGSGFIIDPSGLAVTNNHVVTGAALLKVWVGGDTSKTYNAKVLGVSECSDLAVIDIDGDGFPYLEWYANPVNVGLDVYAAGFPLGDPEFTLTKGIVSKENTDGETDWASVDAVIMHDATINPGNSGGPLINADGKIVGVNYASLASANQYFAIGKEKAVPIIDQLKKGNDIDSIGINGYALSSDDGSISGVFVSSVESGSLADKVDIVGGDLILSLEAHPIGENNTMEAYCDIIRTHSSSDQIAIEVYRDSTGDVLEGQLNGDALVVTYAGAGVDDTSSASGDTLSGCYQTDENAYYEGFQVGSVVILGRHQAVDGDPNWADDMEYYVGDVATITELSGVDDTGCPGVRVDVDGGEFFWRARALQLSSTTGVTSGGGTDATGDDAPAFYVEDFEPGSTTVDNWSWFTTSGDENLLDIYTEDGKLVFDINGNDLYSYFLYDPWLYTDVRVDASAENRGMNNNNVSLICRANDDGWYEFSIANNGLWWIWAYSYDDGYYQLANGGSNAVKMGKDINEYTIMCYEDTLSLYINGTHTHTMEEKKFAFREGQIGIGISSFDALPIKVEFDWVAINENMQ